MAYRINELAKISGVTLRTLRFYDNKGLLKPAYYGINGYRYYEEEQLLMLQQILFFKELGFPLDKIKEVLNRSDFDKIAALYSHKANLEKDAKKIALLIETVEKTVEHLKTGIEMNKKELYQGFNEETRLKYEQQFKEKVGEEQMNQLTAELKENVQSWGEKNWQQSFNAFADFCQGMAQALEKGLLPDSSEVQLLMLQHLKFLGMHWTPTKESYLALKELYQAPESQGIFEPYHPNLAAYFFKAMDHFAAQHWPRASSNDSQHEG
jgi:DNA-binding transcriptional MerR regulator